MKINLFGDKQEKKRFLKVSIAAVTIISFTIVVSLMTDVYGQLAESRTTSNPPLIFSAFHTSRMFRLGRRCKSMSK